MAPGLTTDLGDAVGARCVALALGDEAAVAPARVRSEDDALESRWTP